MRNVPASGTARPSHTKSHLSGQLSPPASQVGRRVGPALYTLRGMRPSTAARPACWVMRTKELKACTVRNKKFCSCSGLNRAAKTEQKSLVLSRQAQRTNQGRISCICTLFESPLCSVSTGRVHPSLVSLVCTLVGKRTIQFLLGIM